MNETSPTPDVVYGLQAKRSGGSVIAVGGWMYYKMFNKISEIQVPESPTTARLMKRCYVDAVCELKEANVFLAGAFAWTGFRQLGVPVQIVHREERSSYTFYKSFQLLVTSITSFSSAPLKFISISGILVSIFAIALGDMVHGEEADRPRVSGTRIHVADRIDLAGRRNHPHPIGRGWILLGAAVSGGKKASTVHRESRAQIRSRRCCR